MDRRAPRATRTNPLCPDTPIFRSLGDRRRTTACRPGDRAGRAGGGRNDDVVGLNAGLTPAAPARQADPAQIRRQRIVRTRRQYNQWVNNDTLEDYALRFTAQKARRWSAWWVANCALGSIAFLACEANGATVPPSPHGTA